MKPYLHSAIAVFISTTLAGCETLNEVSNELMVSAGAGVGCAAISRLAGGDKEDAVIAGAVCAAAGFAVSSELENRRKGFANNEQFYRAELNTLSTYAANLDKEIQTSQSALDTEEAQIARIIDGVSRSNDESNRLAEINEDLQLRQASLKQKMVETEEKRDYQRGLLVHMKQTDSEDTYAASQQLARLESSLRELRGLVSDHEQQTASLGQFI